MVTHNLADSVEDLMNGETPSRLRGATVYEGALGAFGGRRIVGKSSVCSHELFVALYEAPPYDLNVAPLDIPRLSINLVHVPVVGGIASSRSRSYGGRRHSLFFTPANADVHWVKSQHSRHLNLYFHADLFDELSERPAGLLSLNRPLLDVTLRSIRPWIDALELTIGKGGHFAEEVSLGLAHLIISELARAPGRPTPGLPPIALSRVRDYVAANLGQPVRVSDLAAVAGMSAGRFASSFQATLGCPPHRYLLRQRVQSAMLLLRSTPMPMAEVAIECGFASQQHMTTMMRKLAGVTPLKVRTFDLAAPARR